MDKNTKETEKLFPYFANNYLSSPRMTSIYYGRDVQDFLASPFNSLAKLSQRYLNISSPPTSQTQGENPLSAELNVFERLTHHYGKPLWNLKDITLPSGEVIHVEPKEVIKKDFCSLLHFEKIVNGQLKDRSNEPTLLIVAPYSGHHATLLRDTVQQTLHDHDVYITDWANARDVPISKGIFNFDDYMQYLLDFLVYFDRPVHILAVCQPAVPVFAIAALLAQDNSPLQPYSMTLMGGPIDTRFSPTEVNKFALENSIDWFRENIIGHVPAYYLGGLRSVVPGFVLLAGFINLNLDKHLQAPYELFENLVKGDNNTAEAQEKFYDEYRSVLDLPADYYLDSISMVFQDFLLPRGLMTVKGIKVDPSAITKTALLTVEGERDDISGRGQTFAAHALCTNLKKSMQDHYVQPGVGHYGVFNGHRWREIIYPKVAQFIADHEPNKNLSKKTPVI